ncbi:MAG: hypothetical protein WCS27_08290 [Victivallaceae bacterium]
MFYRKIEKYCRTANCALSLFMAFFLISCQSGHNCTSAATQVHERKLQVVLSSRQQREVVRCELQKIGYSRQEAAEAVSELSDEEIEFLHKNPQAIKRSGVVVAILVICGLSVLITSLVEKCSDKKKAANQTGTITTAPTTVTKTKTQKVIIQECPVCKGTGKKICETCGGDGKLEDIMDDSGNPCICQDCNGKGYLDIPCPNCKGTGKIIIKE